MAFTLPTPPATANVQPTQLHALLAREKQDLVQNTFGVERISDLAPKESPTIQQQLPRTTQQRPGAPGSAREHLGAPGSAQELPAAPCTRRKAGNVQERPAPKRFRSVQGRTRKPKSAQQRPKERTRNAQGAHKERARAQERTVERPQRIANGAPKSRSTRANEVD